MGYVTDVTWVTRRHARLVFAVAAAFALCVSGVHAGPAAESAAATPTAQVSGPDNDTANNSSVPHHLDPATYEEPGEIRGLESWLDSHLGARLAASTRNVSQGQYEAARAVVGDAYSDRLDQYVDVAGATDYESDDRTADEFARAQDAQREYVSSTSRYERVHEQYQRARDAGDESRARRLARELQRLATNVTEHRTAVVESYRAVDNGTAVDLTAAMQRTNRSTDEVLATQSTVRDETFTHTSVTLTPDDATLTPTRQSRFTGVLRTADGAPIPNGTVVLRVGADTLTTTTDADGSYALTYRPVALSAATDSARVRYRPASASPYLGATATAPIDVASDPSTVTLAATPRAAAYGESLRVTGDVDVAGAQFAGVPVRVTLGGDVVARTTTNASGAFTATPRLGVRPAAGTATLTVAAGRADTAIEPGRASTPLTVRETATSLALTANASTSTLDVATRLRTPDGGVAGQPVVVRANGTRLATLTTDGDGTANATLALPSRLRPTTGARTLSITAAYAASGTNLEAASARTAVTVSPPPASSSGVTLTQAWILLGAVLVASLLFALAYALWRRDLEADDVPEPAPEPEPDPATPALADRLLATARASLDDAEAATTVETAYAAVRRAFDEDDARLRQRTHWEFYTTLSDTLGDDERAALETLTSTYEHATFAGRPVSHADAEAALAAAERLVEDA